MSTAMQHEWLRRVSDYHSGGVDDTETAAVEEHLAHCAECQQALRMYRRLYALARSPLQLGPPSNTLDKHLSRSEGMLVRFVDEGDTPRRRSRRPRQRPSRPYQTRWKVTIAAVVAAALIIAGFVALLGPFSTGPAKRPVPSPSVVPTAPGSGYINAGPDWATALAFAPSVPETMYACGAPAPSGSALMVAASEDGGHTWQQRTAPETTQECAALTVDPTDPLDALMVTASCGSTGSGTCAANSHLYRSRDGGHTWSAAVSPGGDWIASQLAWSGSTFLMGTTQGIARSILGGPFTLIHLPAIFNQPPYTTTPHLASTRRLFATRDQLIIQEVVCGSGEAECTGLVATSNDLGTNWRDVFPLPDTSHVQIVAVGADGKTLLGTVPYSPRKLGILRSKESNIPGINWEPLAPIPTPLICCGRFFNAVEGASGRAMAEAIAPDGSIIAEFTRSSPDNAGGTGTASAGIYELAPGARSWRYLAPPPTGDVAMFVWDRSGHLAAIWGLRHISRQSGFQYRPV